MKITTFIKENKLLTALFILLIVIFCLTMGLFGFAINSTVEQTTTTSLQELAAQEELVIIRYLEGNLLSLAQTAAIFTDTTTAPDTIRDAENILNSQVKVNPAFYSLYLVDDKGTFYTDKYLKRTEPATLSVLNQYGQDATFYARIDQVENTYAEARQMEFMYAMPLNLNIDGTHIVGIVGKSQIKDLGGKLTVENFDAQGYTIIIDRDGYYLVNQSPKEYSQTARLNFYDRMENEAENTDFNPKEIRTRMNNQETFIIRYTLDDQDLVTYCLPMKNTDELYLLVTVPYDVYGDKVRPFFGAFILVVCAMAGLFTLLCIFLARSVSRAAEARSDARVKSGFLASMSHEIRTPLNGIIGLGHLMKKHINEPDKLAVYLQKHETASHYLLSLINDVLDVSKLQAGKVELSLDICALELLCDSCYSMNAAKIMEKKIVYTINRDIKHNLIVTDSTRLLQILNNIISNAYKFTDSGGKITMDVTQKEDENDMVTTIFRISDTGCGMTPEFMEKIFDEFSQDRNANKESQKGTGLGMAISRKTILLMGGDLTVESEVGKGSAFTVVLPAQTASEKDFKAAVFEESNTSISGALRVLVAEDNDLNSDILCEMLEEEGVSNDLAVNGEEALKMFDASEIGYYNIILMDVQMPKMDGLEATRKIRALDRDDAKTVHIIACSANTFQEDRYAAEDAGMNDFISKPINVKELLEKLNYRK